jgi:16S rRNA (guanine1207-N2)-methyltransferase
MTHLNRFLRQFVHRAFFYSSHYYNIESAIPFFSDIIVADPTHKPDPAFAPAEQKVEIRASEARLFEVAKSLPGKSIVVVSNGRAQSAAMLAESRKDTSVVAWYLDSYRCELARKHNESAAGSLSFSCDPDWPIADDGEVDLACLDFLKGGEAELNRDILQSVYHHLKIGGALVASINNTKDKWLLEQMQSFDKSVKVRKFDDAIVYYVIKKKPLKKLKDFSCQLAFRDEGNLIQLVTRPGVFAHRQFDNGARQILDCVEMFPECSIIEIGCGSGAMSLALAKREPTATLLAIDSYSRAIDCVNRGAELNELSNVIAEVNHDGELGERAGQFDMALANPPYYADFRIAKHFIETAVRALRPGGRLVLVTRMPQWYRDNLGTWLEEVEVFDSRRYHVATGVTRQE